MFTANILIVEDERIIARGLEKRLRDMGYSVVGSVASADEAIRSAIELKPDLTLMDINLGRGMDGIDAASAIREQIDMPVVFLSAFSDTPTIQRAKQVQPYGYVLKPFEDKDLQTCIEISLHRHQFDRQSRENEQWLASTLGSIGDAVIAVDQLGQVRFMNTLAEQLTGWLEADAQGKDIDRVFRIVTAGDRQPVPSPALEAIALREPTAVRPETILLSQTGQEVPIDHSAAPIRGGNGRMSGAVLVFRDVSERMRAEEHRRQAERLEVVGRLAGGVAHDFNNIMTVISGFCELLQGEHSPAERESAIRNIHAASTRAVSLTAQLTAFGRKQMLVPRVVDVNTIVRDLAGILRRLIGDHVRLIANVGPTLKHVRVDAAQLGQVILNLAANARDAMPGGGDLVIETSHETTHAPRSLQSDCLPAGDYVVLCVHDTGAGMSPEVLAHAFEPFFTTKEVGQGTGLGLASVHGIIKQSNGYIDVESVVGRGTTFRIYLPAVEVAPVTGVAQPRTSSPTGTETILLVEDEDMVRRMTRVILERNGYRVLEASCGQDALEISRSHPDPIHLILTDLTMPNMSGLEVVEALARQIPDARAIFMSGYIEAPAAYERVDVRQFDFLPKPFSTAALVHKVREVLDRR